MPAPLTPAQTLKLARYHGYPWDFRNENPLFFGVLSRINSEPEFYDEVVSFLNRIAAIDAAIDASVSTAGIKSLDKGDVVWKDGVGSTLAELKDHKQSLIIELSCLTKVELLNNITTGQGPLNSHFFGGPPGSGAAPQW